MVSGTDSKRYRDVSTEDSKKYFRAKIETCRTLSELKEKMKIPELEQKMICMGCGEYYLVQLYVRDNDKYFPIPRFLCINCDFECDIDELGKIECGR